MSSYGRPDSRHEQRIHLVGGSGIILGQYAEKSSHFDANLRRSTAKVEIDQLAHKTLESRNGGGINALTQRSNLLEFMKEGTITIL